MPTFKYQETPNRKAFDTDRFLDDLHFDEDLSSFSPDGKMLESPDGERDDSSFAYASRPPRWTDDEVSSLTVHACFKMNAFIRSN